MFVDWEKYLSYWKNEKKVSYNKKFWFSNKTFSMKWWNITALREIFDPTNKTKWRPSKSHQEIQNIRQNLWKIPTNNFTSCKWWADEHSKQRKYYWYIPTGTPSSSLVTSHSLYFQNSNFLHILWNAPVVEEKWYQIKCRKRQSFTNADNVV